MKKNILSVILVILILAFASMVIADPTGGTATEGTQTSGVSSSSSTQVTTEGGNVTEVNVTTTGITTRWAGFFGTVTGNYELNDGTNNFYTWATITGSMTGAAVYAADSAGAITWASVAPATSTDMPAYLQTTASDNWTNTYNETPKAFVSSSLNVASTPYTTTSGGAGFESYSLKEGSTLIWAGLVQDDGASFDGATADYQILVPADSSTETYNFYLELP